MKRIVAVILCLLLVLSISACGKAKEKAVVKEPLKKPVKQEVIVVPPDLDTEKGVREYLIGEWACEMEYMSNIVANMIIHENLALELYFYDSFTKELVADYQGDIEFKRIYRDEDDAPDMMSLKFNKEPYFECDYYFFHRTIYDGKRAMSLIFAGLENSVFDIFTGDNDLEYTMGEVVFEKVTGEVTQAEIRKNDAFFGVFWGHGVPYESIWIDDVQWTAREEDYNPNYPVPMLIHENEEPESALYHINPDQNMDILGDDLFKGEVYYVETDEKGNIITLMAADHKRFIDQNADEYIDDIQGAIFSIINDIDEIKGYLDNGLSVLFTEETNIIDGGQCYMIALGTNHEEVFVQERHYAVNIETRQVFEYKVLEDIWEEQ